MLLQWLHFDVHIVIIELGGLTRLSFLLAGVSLLVVVVLLLLLLSWCFMSTKTMKLIKDGRMEVGEEGDYIPITAQSPPECFLHQDGQR